MARTKTPSRATRWADACAQARDALDSIATAKSDLEAAFSDLNDLKGEYDDWKGNLPDSLQSSPVAEKLEAVTALDLEPDLDLDVSDIESALDEAEGADLPLGWGKD